MSCDFETIVNQLTKSYRDIGGINRIDQTNLPSKPAVQEVCRMFLRLLFPGFHDHGAIASTEIESLTKERMEELAKALDLEISKSLQLAGEDSCESSTHRITCRILRRLPEIRTILRTDVEAAYEGDPAAQSFDEVILSYPSIEAVAIQRIAHLLYQENLPLIPRIMTEWAHSRTGIDIHPGAKIGTHFFIDHGTGVVIGETSNIGNHVKLYQGVTLGALSFKKDADGRAVKGVNRHPNVEDNVTVYANATILGGETTIGARTTIGASAFIINNVPADSLVAVEGAGHRIIDKSTREVTTLSS